MRPRSRSPILGIRVKSGWGAAVLLGGPRDRPTVLDSARLLLSDPEDDDTLQPYHAAPGTARTDQVTLRRLIRRVEQCAHAGMKALLAGYREAGRAPAAAVVMGTSDTDPDSITNPHIRIHALEGRLFRRVAEEALTRSGVRCIPLLERTALAEAGDALGVSAAEVKHRLSGLKPPGVPWRSEQKMAALGAWLSLD